MPKDSIQTAVVLGHVACPTIADLTSLLLTPADSVGWCTQPVTADRWSRSLTGFRRSGLW